MNRTSILLLSLGPLLVPGGAAHGTSTGFIQARLVISCLPDQQQRDATGNGG
jgi:hypothetical protein